MSTSFNQLVNASRVYRYSITTTGVSDSLNGDITATATTITLNDASGFASSGKIRIDYEVIYYTGKSGNDLTGCQRGYEFTGRSGYQGYIGEGYAHADTTAVDQVTTAYSDNFAEETAFDYFQDSIEVGDILWFGRHGWLFNDIQVQVGTALAADAITLEWQYHGYDSGAATPSYGANWKDLTVTDNTTNFTVVGQNTITFDPPDDWQIQYWTSHGSVRPNEQQQCTWVRCRVTAVTNPTEGGANATNEVQVGNNTLEVTGGTSGTRLTLADVYDDDVTAGWGVVTEREQFGGSTAENSLNMSYYTINANLKIGDGSTPTYFDFKNHDICFLNHCKFIQTTAESDSLFGTQRDTYNAGFNGPFIYLQAPITQTEPLLFNAGTINAYNLRLRIGVSTWSSFNVRLDNTNATYIGLNLDLPESQQAIPYLQGTTLRDCVFTGSIRSMSVDANTTIDGGTFWVTGFQAISGYFRYSGGSQLIITDVDASDVYPTYDEDNGAQCHVRSSNTHLVLRDCKGFRYKPNIYWNNYSPTPKQSLQYGLSLKIVDNNNSAIESADVVITNPNISDIELTTDASGEITTQYLYFCDSYYNGSVVGYWDTADTIDYYGNYTITISKSGYITQTHKITMNEKKSLTFTLEQAKDINFSRHGRITTQ
ncbi:MAG: hypothetical protein PHG63_02950 [Candidatus Dojkabacteria bacterium]|nr:hypothetical protein [Candidatus Dojkabacteria bacterium]